MKTELNQGTIIVRNKHPHDYDEVILHKGQLYLDTRTGNYFQASTTGRDVEWVPAFVSAPSEGDPGATPTSEFELLDFYEDGGYTTNQRTEVAPGRIVVRTTDGEPNGDTIDNLVQINKEGWAFEHAERSDADMTEVITRSSVRHNRVQVRREGPDDPGSQTNMYPERFYLRQDQPGNWNRTVDILSDRILLNVEDPDGTQGNQKRLDYGVASEPLVLSLPDTNGELITREDVLILLEQFRQELTGYGA